MYELLNILQSNGDLSSCLANCSNQGFCKLSTNQTFICKCNANFKGKSCQTDERPCSQSNKCLNNGTCVNSVNLTSFQCQCPLNGPYYGQYCENVRNLCENVTCSSRGYCAQSQNETKCKCYKGFEGEQCEIELNSVKILKSVQWLTTVICIIVLTLFWAVVINFDILSYLNIGHKRIDLDDWKHEQYHGYKREKGEFTSKTKLNVQRFYYKPWSLKTN